MHSMDVCPQLAQQEHDDGIAILLAATPKSRCVACSDTPRIGSFVASWSRLLPFPMSSVAFTHRGNVEVDHEQPVPTRHHRSLSAMGALQTLSNCARRGMG